MELENTHVVRKYPFCSTTKKHLYSPSVSYVEIKWGYYIRSAYVRLQQPTKTLYGGTNDNKNHPDGIAVVSLLMFLFWQIESELFVYNGEKKVFHTPFANCPWDMTSPGPITGCSSISLEWCKWWQIPSSLIMCVQLIGVTHRDGCVLALGWGAELPDWIIQKWPAIRPLSGRFLSVLLWQGLPFTCVQKQHLPLSAELCVMREAHYSNLSQDECVNVIQVLHMSMSGIGLCI